MQLHLDANYPERGFHRFSDRQLNSEAFSRSWILQSMLVCSWLTAQPALDVRAATREYHRIALIHYVRVYWMIESSL